MLKNKVLLVTACLCFFVVIACQKDAGIIYPSLPSSLKVGSTLALEVKPGAKALDFKWWVKYEQMDWVPVKNWGPDNTLNLVPDKPGIYAVQVDVREKGKETELEKKWLGQIQVAN
ncbi:MAG: hypothetical protein HZB33_10355 [Nitrospirae bacterium]|nr:hypothetical protein [Nitrospirota bacterium]